MSVYTDEARGDWVDLIHFCVKPDLENKEIRMHLKEIMLDY